jgi:4-alpha-glucanotransferase
MTLPPSIERLALLYGVQLSYYDNAGQQHVASTHAVMSLLRCMGLQIQNENDAERILAQKASEQNQRRLEPVIVAWDGLPLRVNLRSDDAAARVRYELYLEDGNVRSGTLDPVGAQRAGETQYSIPGELPLGYHDLVVETEHDQSRALVIAAPQRARQLAPGENHGLGIFLPLYAARTEGSHGLGDFGSLGKLLAWSDELGSRFVGTLPLLATFLDEPFEPSPYSPVSRLFWNELFLDLQQALALIQCSPAQNAAADPEFMQAVERLNAADLVDYRENARLKRQVLEPLAGCFFDSGGERSNGYREFLALYPRAEDYAQFRATVERERRGWQVWPQRQRDGALESGDYDQAVFNYHRFSQFLAHQQLQNLSSATRSRLYLDLPIGVNGAGYDVWRERELFAAGVSAGAPPDAFFTRGQSWGFPPLTPFALREQGYRYLREAMQTHLRYAGALRLDHVMALHRLFWVPNDSDPTDGVYVRYRAEELFALLCLESHRHDAVIIGEDLGTVPPEVREGMERHNILRMYVVQFEVQPNAPDPLARPPATSVASLNTHDMPTFAAYRGGRDAELRRELGLFDDGQVAQAHAHRAEALAAIAGQLQRAGFLHHPPEPKELRDALLDFLAHSDAALVLINLEDLWDEERPQNVPGTGAERPNWRRKARLSFEQMISSPDINAALRRLTKIRS